MWVWKHNKQLPTYGIQRSCSGHPTNMCSTERGSLASMVSSLRRSLFLSYVHLSSLSPDMSKRLAGCFLMICLSFLYLLPNIWAPSVSWLAFSLKVLSSHCSTMDGLLKLFSMLSSSRRLLLASQFLLFLACWKVVTWLLWHVKAPPAVSPGTCRHALVCLKHHIILPNRPDFDWVL